MKKTTESLNLERNSRPLIPSFGGALVLGPLMDVTLWYFLDRAGMALCLSHMASLLVSAAAAYLFGWRKWGAEEAGSPLGRACAFGVVILLAAFLRGAILGWMTKIDECPPLLMMTVGSAAAYLVLGAWMALRSSVSPGSSEREPDFWARWALVMVAYAVALRVIYLGLPELLHEETYYWNYSRHPSLGYLDHPPMVGWIIWIFTTLLGHNELAVRMGAFSTWLVGAFYVFQLSKTLFDKTAGTVAVLLFAVLPAYYMFGFVMLPDAPLTACWAGALYYFFRVFVLEKRSAWFGAGLFIGLGMLSKYTIALLGMAAFVFLISDRRALKWLKTPFPYLSVLLALFICSPVLIWNAQNEWASFMFQGPKRVFSASDFDIIGLLGSIMVLITPVGLLSVSAVCISRKTWALGEESSKNHVISKAYRLLLLLTLIPFSVFFFFSFFHSVKLNWTGPLWLGVLPFLARLITKPLPSKASRLHRWARAPWRITIIFLLVFLGVAMHYMVLGLPKVPYPQNQIGLGWPDLGVRFQKITREVEKETGRAPLVVGMDRLFLSGWLAFYRSRAMGLETGRNTGAGSLDTGGRHLFGYDSNMFRFWFPPEAQAQKTMILVSEKPHDINNEVIDGFFESGGPVKEICSFKNGHLTGRFYYRVLHGYHPPRS